jgi:hypothetical protein
MYDVYVHACVRVDDEIVDDIADEEVRKTETYANVVMLK